MFNKKIKVVYIAGSGRSGSTLLERLLGQVNGIFAGGELRFIWDRGFQNNQLCGCGEHFNACRIWKNISERVIECLNNKYEINDIIQLESKLTRFRNYVKLNNNFFIKELNILSDQILPALYNSIQSVAKSNVIIDSSKHPAYLHILLNCSFIDLYVIHIIRDSRAVTYSWQRKKVRPEIKAKTVYMDTFSPVNASLQWIAFNYLNLTKKKLIGNCKYKLIKYEDLISNPQAIISAILDFIKVNSNLSFFAENNVANLYINHTISGNPIRFNSGIINIHEDTEWKSRMSIVDKILVTILTFPLMHKFYYRK